MTNPNLGALPELLLAGDWQVRQGSPHISLVEKTLYLPSADNSLLAHELGHAAISPPIHARMEDKYCRALEDCRVNQWLRSKGIADMAAVHEEKVLSLVNKLVKSGAWVDAILCLFSVGRHTYRKNGASFPATVFPLLNRLGKHVFELLEPENGQPAPFSRVPQLAEILRAMFEPPIELPCDVTGGGGDIPGLEESLANSASMEILSPPRTRNCLQSKARTNRPRNEGMIPLRFDRLLIDGAVFHKRLRDYRAGTVLIDDSGSMSLTSKDIESLAQSLPFGTIAYYSSSPQEGTLVIAACKGKMISHILDCGGCNAVDVPAILWLAKQKGPLHYVGDCGFTGRGDNPLLVNREALLEFMRAKQITIYRKPGRLLSSLSKA